MGEVRKSVKTLSFKSVNLENAQSFPPPPSQPPPLLRYLAGSGRALCVSEASTDHGVSDPVAPELLLLARLEVDDGQASLVQSLSQRNVLLPT